MVVFCEHSSEPLILHKMWRLSEQMLALSERLSHALIEIVTRVKFNVVCVYCLADVNFI